MVKDQRIAEHSVTFVECRALFFLALSHFLAELSRTNVMSIFEMCVEASKHRVFGFKSRAQQKGFRF